MKHLYLITLLTIIAVAAKAQNYYTATAIKSGNWSDTKIWNSAVRQDGVKTNKFIIPANVSVTLNDDADITSIGDVDLEIVGKLEFKSDNSLFLTEKSVINIKSGGVITLHANAMNQSNDKKIEQILIGNIVKFDGNKQTSITGPATASMSTGSAPSGFVSNAMLPVNFVAFTASKQDEESIALSWTTTDEINNNHFEIQRSNDGINFKSVAIVLPGTDNSNIHLYKYNDRYTSKGVIYYRIRQVDHDGKEKYSMVKMVGGFNNSNDAKIYVAGNKTVTVELSKSEGNVMVRVVSLSGVVISQKSNIPAGQKVSINAYNASAGAYVVQVSDMKGMFTSKKVLL